MTLKWNWNWGTGITLAYSSFVVFMLFMVYLCLQQEFDLVTPDYYEDELKYQEVIDGIHNAGTIGKAMMIEIGDDAVNVTLPMDVIDAKGIVHIYRPNKASLDLLLPLSLDGKITIGREKLKPGLYKVKATWSKDGKPFFMEQPMFIP
jgi:hypothetical protein